VKVNFITSNTVLLNLIVPIIFKSFVESVLFALETSFRRKSVKQAYLFYWHNIPVPKTFVSSTPCLTLSVSVSAIVFLIIE